jgi:hypothetical protein
MLTDLQIMQQLAQYSGTIVDFGINYHSNQPPHVQQGQAGNTYGTNGINYSQMFSQGQSSPMSVPMASHDYPGSAMAGTPYMIGTPEVFIPKTGGDIIPIGGADKKSLGNTIIINITNPKREVAENSIRDALKKLSYLGVAA